MGRVLAALPRTAPHGHRGGTLWQPFPRPPLPAQRSVCSPLPLPSPPSPRGCLCPARFPSLSLATFPHCSRCVLMWPSYPQPSQLASLPDCETPHLLVSHETAFPRQFALPSPLNSASICQLPSPAVQPETTALSGHSPAVHTPKRPPSNVSPSPPLPFQQSAPAWTAATAWVISRSLQHKSTL